jgi:predicted nucleotidyltransferase
MTTPLATAGDNLPSDTRSAILGVAQSHGATRVAVFGSFTRNEQRPRGDLDLLVDFEPGRSLLDLVGMKQELEDLLGIKVDIVTSRGLSPYIRDEVLRTLIPL